MFWQTLSRRCRLLFCLLAALPGLDARCLGAHPNWLSLCCLIALPQLFSGGFRWLTLISCCTSQIRILAPRRPTYRYPTKPASPTTNYLANCKYCSWPITSTSSPTDKPQSHVIPFL
ncbi:hypothetical protein VTG60DRAFT_1039 [Thermothelomyces hinnuleus]